MHHPEPTVLLMDVFHHEHVPQVANHLIIALLVVEQVLIEHRIVIVLVVVLDELLVLKLLSIISDCGNVLANSHSEMISFLDVRLLLFEKAPKVNDVCGGVFKEPIEPLLHLARLYERRVVNLFFSMVPELVHDELKHIVLSNTKCHLSEDRLI